MASINANLLEQNKTGLGWNTSMAAAFIVLEHLYGHCDFMWNRSILVKLQQIMYFYYFIDPVARLFCLRGHGRVSDKTSQWNASTWTQH